MGQIVIEKNFYHFFLVIQTYINLTGIEINSGMINKTNCGQILKHKMRKVKSWRFQGNELKYVKQVLDFGFKAGSDGTFTSRLENLFSKILCLPFIKTNVICEVPFILIKQLDTFLKHSGTF